jgi:hypothetical protein
MWGLEGSSMVPSVTSVHVTISVSIGYAATVSRPHSRLFEAILIPQAVLRQFTTNRTALLMLRQSILAKPRGRFYNRPMKVSNYIHISITCMVMKARIII